MKEKNIYIRKTFPKNTILNRPHLLKRFQKLSNSREIAFLLTINPISGITNAGLPSAISYIKIEGKLLKFYLFLNQYKSCLLSISTTIVITHCSTA